MDCLLSFCIYVTAGLGVQSGHAFDGDGYKLTGPQTNEYGLLVGEGALNARTGYICADLRHMSGISTAEGDMGLNTAMIGPCFTFSGITVKTTYGVQTQLSDSPSNNYGKYVAEASVMYEFTGLFDGFFVKASKIDDMENIIFGMIKRF